MSADVAPGPVLGAGAAPAATAADPAAARSAGRPVVQAAVLGGALSVVNAFVLASLQGAVGVVGEERTLLRVWVGGSLLLWPVYVAMVLGVLRLVARRGPAGGVRRSLVATVAVALAAAVVGASIASVVAVWDYRVQAQQITSVGWSHFHAAGTDPALVGGSVGCDAVCVVKHQTASAHVKSIAMSSPVVLGLDLVAAFWLLAAFGGEVALPRARRKAAPDLSELVGTP